MNIKKLNLEQFHGLEDAEAILFKKPVGSKLYRVDHVPPGLRSIGKYADCIDILNAACTIKRKSVWYFAPEDTDTMMSALETFCMVMDLPAYLVQPEQFGRDDAGFAKPEILN